MIERCEPPLYQPRHHEYLRQLVQVQALHLPQQELVHQQERAHQQDQDQNQMLVLDLAQLEWAHQQTKEEQEQQEEVGL